MLQKLLLFSLLVVIGCKWPQKNVKPHLVWSDEFNYSGLPDSSKWNYDVGCSGWGNNEKQVVSLLNQGQLGNLPKQNRFRTALDYVKAINAQYAKTAIGGAPSEDPKEPGVLIGSWTDYTPSSALDIQTTTIPNIDDI